MIVGIVRLITRILRRLATSGDLAIRYNNHLLERHAQFQALPKALFRRVFRKIYQAMKTFSTASDPRSQHARRPVQELCPGAASTRKRFHRKVRSGCRSCKQRHLKCDEGQPMCLRCSKAGFECEYDTIKPWIFEMRSKDSSAQHVQSESQLGSSLVHLHDKTSDTEHFQFFCENTSRMFASYLTEMCLQVHSELDQIAAITRLGKTSGSRHFRQLRWAFLLSTCRHCAWCSGQSQLHDGS